MMEQQMTYGYVPADVIVKLALSQTVSAMTAIRKLNNGSLPEAIGEAVMPSPNRLASAVTSVRSSTFWRGCRQKSVGRISMREPKELRGRRNLVR